jgi:hypothetical protein
MKTLVLLTLALTLTGADDERDGEPVTVEVVAVQATQENRPAKFYAPGLEWLEELLEQPRDYTTRKLASYDTYRKIASDRKRTVLGKQAVFPINRRYTLYVTPVAKAPDGRIRVQSRIVEKREDKEQKGWERPRLQLRIGKKTQDTAEDRSSSPILGYRPLTPRRSENSEAPVRLVKALDTTSLVAPGRRLLLGGLNLDAGQLVVAVTLSG